jgi:hypothetical protein
MINAAATYYHITLSDTNYIEFRKQIRELQKKDIENLPISNSYPLKQIYNFLLNHKNDLMNAISNILDPDKNDFKLLNTKELLDFCKNRKQNNEIWTDSSCVFIEYKAFVEIKEKLENKLDKKLNIPN